MTIDLFRPRKPKRRRMKAFKLDEISVVDTPAQEEATARLMKRKGSPMSLYAPHNMQVVMKAKEAIQGIIAKAKEDLRGNPRATGPTEEVDRAELDGNFDEEEVEILAGDEGDEEEKADEHDDEEAAAERLRALLGKDEEAEEDDYQDDEVDEEAALRHEVRQAKAQLRDDEEDEEFDESTEHGRIANALRRRDPSISKARAALMATGRRAASSGIYAKLASRTYGKAAARSTTSAAEPFHQPSAAERRAEMDRTARAHRANVNAEIEAMRGAFGREGEMRRRAIDKMVIKLRETDRNMPHTVALRKIRAQYPGLF